MKKYNKEKMRYQDQDILNGLFADDVFLLENRFNFMPWLFSRIKKGLVAKDTNGYEKVQFPIVIFHYCGISKPWHIDNTIIKTNHYFKLAKELGIDLYKDTSYSKRLRIKIQRMCKEVMTYLRYGIY